MSHCTGGRTRESVTAQGVDRWGRMRDTGHRGELVYRKIESLSIQSKQEQWWVGQRRGEVRVERGSILLEPHSASQTWQLQMDVPKTRCGLEKWLCGSTKAENVTMERHLGLDCECERRCCSGSETETRRVQRSREGLVQLQRRRVFARTARNNLNHYQYHWMKSHRDRTRDRGQWDVSKHF